MKTWFDVQILIPILAFCLILPLDAASHGSSKEDSTTTFSGETLTRINQNYLVEIRPIFQSKCFDCHSSKTSYPWYYKIPGIQQLIDHDIKEGKEHLDVTNDFPFVGHGSPDKDLEEVAEVIEEGEMPPFLYRLMHSNAKITEEEKTKILRWVSESRSLLKDFPH